MPPLCKDSNGNKQLEKSKQVVEKIAMSFPKYFDTLDPPAKKKRYCKKLKLIDDVDPDAIEYENFTYDMNCFPAITYSDIVNYLAFGTSFFSEEDMKADKSLDACNQVLEW